MPDFTVNPVMNADLGCTINVLSALPSGTDTSFDVDCCQAYPVSA